MSRRLQRRIQNSVKHLMIIFTKHSILDVYHGPEYTCGLLKLFCSGSQRDTWDFLMYAKLIILLTPNLEFPPYSEVIQLQHSRNYNIQANKRLAKVKEK